MPFTITGGKKNGKTLYLKLFVVGLYFLLKDHIQYLSQVTIDREYPGRNAEIKLYLINILNRRGISYDPAIIRFAQIGKRSSARHKAFAVFTRVQRPDKQLTAAQILGEFKKQ